MSGGAAAAAQAKGVLVSDTVWSQALGIRKHLLVWLPPSYGTETSRRYPVAYYLHGANGDETNWTKLGHLDQTLDSLTAAGLAEMIVVMPDGDDGWYTTWNFLGDYPACRRAHAEPGKELAATYCVPWPKYDDYIARDLVAYIDRTYRTRADRAHRGIAGLSMGGYGAVSLALSYPEVFSAAASHSGVLTPFMGMRQSSAVYPSYATRMDSLRLRWGQLWVLIAPAFGKDTTAWWARDPARKAARLGSERPALAPRLKVDCGTEDPLLDENRALRDRLFELGWQLDYAEFPGTHSWDYWRPHSSESVEWLARQIGMP